MKCRTFERWISDDLDGRLPGRKKEQLGAHLSSCDSCRRYKKEVTGLQAQAKGLFTLHRSPEFWEDFSRRLETKVSSIPGPQSGRGGLFKARWTWAAAGALLLAVTGFFILRNSASSYRESDILSYEDSLSRLFQTIDSDPLLEASFNQYVLDSIGEISESESSDPAPQLGDDSFFWASLSLEELIYLEQELRKENRLTEVPK